MIGCRQECAPHRLGLCWGLPAKNRSTHKNVSTVEVRFSRIKENDKGNNTKKSLCSGRKQKLNNNVNPSRNKQKAVIITCIN